MDPGAEQHDLIQMGEGAPGEGPAESQRMGQEAEELRLMRGQTGQVGSREDERMVSLPVLPVRVHTAGRFNSGPAQT